MDISVTPLNVTDAAGTEHGLAIMAACTAVDLPDFPPTCRQSFFGALHHPFPGHRVEYALAHLDGEPVGYLKLTLPQLENTDNVDVDLNVHPAHRRRGVGRALFDHTVRRARELGRKRIFSMTPAPLPDGPPRDEPGTGFATGLGAKLALVDVRRRLDVTAVDDPDLDRQLAAARAQADGYSLVRWAGPAPQEYVDDVAYLDSRLLADAPMGDLEWEPEQTDATRVRKIEAVREARGRRAYHAGMRHDATGRLVAWTTIDVDGSHRWHAFQQITLVEPNHRGHRLGIIVKIENLRYAVAEEPELRYIDTWNAASNGYMISINEAMGFRPVDGWNNWQLDI